jgi:hypothetical protein
MMSGDTGLPCSRSLGVREASLGWLRTAEGDHGSHVRAARMAKHDDLRRGAAAALPGLIAGYEPGGALEGSSQAGCSRSIPDSPANHMVPSRAIARS